MVLIESNPVMRGVQDRIFVLRVLFGLVMTQSSHVGDDATKSVLVVEWCHHWDMLVMTLPSRASNGATESVMVIARQGTATDRQGAVVECQGDAADRQCAIAGRGLPKRLSLREMLIMEGIDLDVMDLHNLPHGGRQLSWFMTMI
jgi:hypothetical protein